MDRRMIRFDGRNWIFTPGENGSLVSQDKFDMKPTLLENVDKPSVAKTIMSPDLIKKRQVLAKALK